MPLHKELEVVLARLLLIHAFYLSKIFGKQVSDTAGRVPDLSGQHGNMSAVHDENMSLTEFNEQVAEAKSRGSDKLIQRKFVRMEQFERDVVPPEGLLRFETLKASERMRKELATHRVRRSAVVWGGDSHDHQAMLITCEFLNGTICEPMYGGYLKMSGTKYHSGCRLLNPAIDERGRKKVGLHTRSAEAKDFYPVGNDFKSTYSWFAKTTPLVCIIKDRAALRRHFSGIKRHLQTKKPAFKLPSFLYRLGRAAGLKGKQISARRHKREAQQGDANFLFSSRYHKSTISNGGLDVNSLNWGTNQTVDNDYDADFFSPEHQVEELTKYMEDQNFIPDHAMDDSSSQHHGSSASGSILKGESELNGEQGEEERTTSSESSEDYYVREELLIITAYNKYSTKSLPPHFDHIQDGITTVTYFYWPESFNMSQSAFYPSRVNLGRNSTNYPTTGGPGGSRYQIANGFPTVVQPPLTPKHLFGGSQGVIKNKQSAQLIPTHAVENLLTRRIIDAFRNHPFDEDPVASGFENVQRFPPMGHFYNAIPRQTKGKGKGPLTPTSQKSRNLAFVCEYLTLLCAQYNSKDLTHWILHRGPGKNGRTSEDAELLTRLIAEGHPAITGGNLDEKVYGLVKDVQRRACLEHLDLESHNYRVQHPEKNLKSESPENWMSAKRVKTEFKRILTEKDVSQQRRVPVMTEEEVKSKNFQKALAHVKPHIETGAKVKHVFKRLYIDPMLELLDWLGVSLLALE